MDIYLADFNENLFEEFYKLKCEKDNIYWTNHLNLPNRLKFLKWCKLQLKNKNRKILIANENKNDTVVGYGYIDFIEKDLEVVEISYAISEKFMGRGLGRKIVKALVNYCIQNHKKIQMIQAWVLKDNERSKRCLLSNNFNQTTEMKEIFFEPYKLNMHMIKYEYFVLGGEEVVRCNENKTLWEKT